MTHPVTWIMVLRACLKALGLFAVFTLIYGIINPVENGLLPTLYNGLIPGRLRFHKNYEFDAYRLIADHAISAAQPDTFNIVVLGGSEMWGPWTLPDGTTPALMDQMGLVSADGRPVRVYNLAAPYPYGLRDLIVLSVALEKHIPIDLVLVSTLDATMSYGYPYTEIAWANVPLAMKVIQRYGLTQAYQYVDGSRIGVQTPVYARFWRDQSALSVWLGSQIRGLTWVLAGNDLNSVIAELTPGHTMAYFADHLELNRVAPADADFLYAYKLVSQEQGIAVIILDAPVPYKTNDFAPWLQAQTASIGLPLLDCWQVFQEPGAFADRTHLMPYMHSLYARILAAALNDPVVAGEGRGLPLTRPVGFEAPSNACVFHPSAS